MRSHIPKHMQEKVSTRSRSKKQETNIAKRMKVNTTVNSGATFGQNDAIGDYCEIEAKTTKFKSYSINMDELNKLSRKCSTNKIPIQIVCFEDNLKQQYAVLKLTDLEFLIEQING
jgi:hypothetical protein